MGGMALAGLTATLLVGRVAPAQAVVRQACVDADEAAQVGTLPISSHARPAGVGVCLRATCPGMVRSECARSKGRVRAVAPGNTTILATDGATLVQGRSIVFVPADGLTLSAIVVTPNPAPVGVGETLQLRAQGVYSDGSTKDLTRGVTWSSSRGDVVAVDTAGLIGGVIVGDSTVTANAPDPTSSVRGSAAAKVVP